MCGWIPTTTRWRRRWRPRSCCAANASARPDRHPNRRCRSGRRPTTTPPWASTWTAGGQTRTTKTTSRTFDGVRNRAQRRYFGHLGMLGHDPAMPRQTVQVVATRHRGAAGVSTVRRPGHVVSDPGISRRLLVLIDFDYPIPARLPRSSSSFQRSSAAGICVAIGSRRSPSREGDSPANSL